MTAKTIPFILTRISGGMILTVQAHVPDAVQVGVVLTDDQVRALAFSLLERVGDAA